MTNDVKKALELMKLFPDLQERGKDGEASLEYSGKPDKDGNVFFSATLDYDPEKGMVFIDYYKAVRVLQEPATQGDPEAQFGLAAIFLDAPGSIHNPEMAVAWLLKVAATGHASAQFRLGDCFASGTGVAQNFARAVKFYKKSAAQNHSGGQFGLGICYANGTGVKQNLKTAKLWLEKSAAQGNDFAKHNLEMLGAT